MIYAIVFGILALLFLFRICYVQGFRRAYKEYYNNLYLPFYKTHDATMKTLSKIVSDSPEQAIQTNLALSAQNRRLKRKVILLARRYGYVARENKMSFLYRLPSHVSNVMEFMRQLHENEKDNS